MRRLLLALCALSGCAPADGPSPSTIDGLRVLAVRAEPAEAPPGSPVRLQATVADADGLRDTPITWAWCLTPKPPTENNAVAAECLADGVAPIGVGAGVDAALPTDGCRLFGPQSPGPGLRPRDPDVTGGYHQPVRLEVDGAVAFGAVRLRCDLAQAPLAVARAFAEDYAANVHPRIEDFAPPESVEAGGSLSLSLAADAPETYLRFDPASRALETRTEQLTVSWFVTGGAVEPARVDATDRPAEARWSAPDAPGTYSVIAVLRDSRGGVAVAERRITVR